MTLLMGMCVNAKKPHSAAQQYEINNISQENMFASKSRTRGMKKLDHKNLDFCFTGQAQTREM